MNKNESLTNSKNLMLFTLWMEFKQAFLGRSC